MLTTMTEEDWTIGLKVFEASRSRRGDKGRNDRKFLEALQSGGPPVEKPRRRSLGSTLIERGLAHELDGETKLEFEPTGLRCTIVTSLASVEGLP